MSYEAWRVSYQSGEQAARAAWDECERLREIIAEQRATIGALMIGCDDGTTPVLIRMARQDAEIERLRESAGAYHHVMECLRGMDMPHGLCEPRERMACTHCNAKDRLAKLKAEYRGPRIVASSGLA